MSCFPGRPIHHHLQDTRCHNFAALRNAALGCLRADATGNLAATLRSHYRKPQRLFTKLGLL